MTPNAFLQGLYGEWFTFALYFLIFGSVIRFSLEKPLGDSTAKRVAVSFGLLLAAALWLLEQKLGLSLGSLGPVSLSLLLAVFIGVQFRYMQWATESTVLALALCLGTVLAVFAFFVPQWRAVGVKTGYAAFLLLAATWIFGRARASGSTGRSTKPRAESRLPDRKAIKDIERHIRKSLATFPSREIKRLGKAMEHTRKKLEENGGERSTMLKLENELLSLEQEGNILAEHLRRTQELDKALQRLDLDWLQETYSVGRHLLVQGERQRLQRLLKVERNRLGVDRKLEALAEQGLKVLEELKHHLEQCRRLLRRDDQKSLQHEVAHARRRGKEASKLYLHARHLEKQLLHLYEVQEKQLTS